jgi:hypothetical protein
MDDESSFVQEPLSPGTNTSKECIPMVFIKEGCRLDSAAQWRTVHTGMGEWVGACVSVHSLGGVIQKRQLQQGELRVEVRVEMKREEILIHRIDLPTVEFPADPDVRLGAVSGNDEGRDANRHASSKLH